MNGRVGRLAEDEPCGVPQFGGEVSAEVELVRRVAALCILLDRQTHILRFGGHGGQRETQRIGTVGIDDLDRVHAVALALAHPLALAIEDGGVDSDMVEGNATHVVDAGHHHPRHPERDDVSAGEEDGTGVILCQFGGLFGPAEGGVGPEGRAKPSIEDVWVLAGVRRINKLLAKVKSGFFRFVRGKRRHRKFWWLAARSETRE